MAKKGGNPQNLKPSSLLTPEERKERAAKGGKKKAENIRKRKAMKEQLEMLMQMPVRNEKGLKALSKNGVYNAELADNQAAMLAVALNKAIDGRIEYIEFIRDTIGEKPVNNMQLDAIATVQTISEDDRKLLERVEKRLRAEQKKQGMNETG